MSRVLVINSGSSSLKFQITDPVEDSPVAVGVVARIGSQQAEFSLSAGEQKTSGVCMAEDHAEAFRVMSDLLAEAGLGVLQSGVVAIGHRVVHGGQMFSEPAAVNEELLQQVEALTPLAPLHNPANVVGMRAAQELFPGLPQVAVFDTAFFAGLPEDAAIYAVDADFARRYGVRRYGFHGTSHEFVAGRVAEFLERPVSSLRQIICHLGNGASVSAVSGGQPVDTSLGMTPVEGLVMGTRSGDIDPGVLLFAQRQAGLSVDEVDDLLNKRSGMLGLCGVSDFRDIIERVESGDTRARLALDVYVRRLRKYLGAYMAVLQGVDVITFTAGVGENTPEVRAEAIAALEWAGVRLDADANEDAGLRGPRRISAPDSTVEVLVIPTNEELAIAEKTLAVVGR